jgi:hypothetical protein
LKRITVLFAMGLILAFSFVDAQAVRFSAGAYGGLNFPVAMDEATSGSMFGIKGRVVVLPMIGVEPYFNVSNYGNVETEVFDEVMEREGGDITSFGLNLALGMIQGRDGLGVYGILGLESAKYARSGLDDITEASYTGGLGLEFGFREMVTVDFRGKVQIMPVEDGTYKNGSVSVGVNVFFGEFVGGE